MSDRTTETARRSPLWGRPLAWIDVIWAGLILLAAACGVQRFPTLEGSLAAVFVIVLVLTAARTDLASRRIPNALTYPAFVIAALLVVAFAPREFSRALAGVLAGAGPLLLAAVIVHSGVGMGDVKLMAVVGLLLGFPAAMTALMVAVLLAGTVSVAGLMTKRLRRKQAIPLGPFLALGTLYALFEAGPLIFAR